MIYRRDARNRCLEDFGDGKVKSPGRAGRRAERQSPPPQSPAAAPAVK
ncbi:MAG: hypothetical protein QW379_06875 [Thermoplasmata archaeon]